MREITQYTLKEWIKLDPPIWYLKEKRNDAVSRKFVRTRPATLQPFLDTVRDQSGKNMAVVVAFNSPWVVGVLLPALKKHLTDASVIVCDNSNDSALRPEIEEVCKSHDTPYIGLPPNPERHPCRSHGIALNWIYYNIIREINPARFACIDHDLIPFRDYTIADQLESQPVYGHLSKHPWSWYLWAGFSMFDYGYTRNKAVNFLNDRPSELDTGGRNWKPLLRQLDESTLTRASTEFVSFRHPQSDEKLEIHVLEDTWMHLCGVGLSPKRKDKFSDRAAFFQALFDYADAGGRLADLITDAG